jgi:hypothetical protein
VWSCTCILSKPCTDCLWNDQASTKPGVLEHGVEVTGQVQIVHTNFKFILLKCINHMHIEVLVKHWAGRAQVWWLLTWAIGRTASSTILCANNTDNVKKVQKGPFMLSKKCIEFQLVSKPEWCQCNMKIFEVVP